MYNLTVNDLDREVFEKELRSFLPEEIVDIHTHIWKSDLPRQGCPNGGSTWVDRVADEMSGDELMDTYRRLFPGNIPGGPDCHDPFHSFPSFPGISL